MNSDEHHYSQPLHSNSPACSTSNFYFKHISDFSVTHPDWLVENICECETLTMIYGEPSSGKTFFALDLAAHIATGKPWNGHKVSPGGVLFCAGEGQSGLIRRRCAWETHHSLSLKTYHLYLSSGAIDLAEKGSLDLIHNKISDISASVDLKLAVIDTLSRHHGGDENSASEMAKFVRGLDLLRQEFKIAVLLIHHSGKDMSKGARGSSALRAALDTEIVISNRNQITRINNTKQKDADLFPEMYFQLSAVDLVDELGHKTVDPHGKSVSSCVLVPCEAPDNDKPSQSLGPNQKKFEEAFTKLCNQGLYPVPIKWLRQESGIDSKRWSEVVKSQAINEKYGFDENYVWLINPTGDN